MKGFGGVGWDKKEFLDPNLHVYGRDDTKIRIYNMKRWPKEKKEGRKLCNDPLNSCNLVLSIKHYNKAS